MKINQENNSTEKIRRDDEKIIDLRKSVKSRYIIKKFFLF